MSSDLAPFASLTPIPKPRSSSPGRREQLMGRKCPSNSFLLVLRVPGGIPRLDRLDDLTQIRLLPGASGISVPSPGKVKPAGGAFLKLAFAKVFSLGVGGA